VDLWKTSGHFDFYSENMYDQMQVETEEYQLKPMNCPFHVAMYKDGYHSYRDLPIRMAELGTVYRCVLTREVGGWGGGGDMGGLRLRRGCVGGLNWASCNDAALVCRAGMRMRGGGPCGHVQGWLPQLQGPAAANMLH
jgi:hypothetical protein